MSDIDPQLVKQIARQVLEAMGQRPPASGNGSAAQVKPAIGICTGDYSQFTDRPDLSPKPTPSGVGGPPPLTPAPLPPPRPVLTGIVTAQQLQDAIDAAPDKLVLLAPDARLSPLAADLARDKPQHVRRETPADASATRPLSGSGSLLPGGRPLLWWTDGRCPAVAALTHRLTDQLRPLTAPPTDGGLTQVVQDLARTVRTGRVVGGILFVQRTAKAALLANRCETLRAVVACCLDAAHDGLEQVQANTLIVPYAKLDHDTLQQMTLALLHHNAKPDPQLQRQLAQLHRL